MSAPTPPLILGEYRRVFDERYRVSVPTELLALMSEDEPNCILAKEQPGALSLWRQERWQERLDRGVALVRDKMQAGRLDGRLEEVQLLGRLLSTRHKLVQLGGRGRLLIPEGFREFLGVEAGGDVLIVGAAVCVEIWRPDAWLEHLKHQMPGFSQLFDNLTG